MTCERCDLIPNAHSFIHFGAVNGINLFYTSPARAIDYKETAETFNYYKTHIDSAKNNKWIWMVDCEGMQMKHYSSIEIIKKLIQMILDEHKGLLQSIWIIHPNTWIKTALMLIRQFLNKDIYEKIQMIDGDKMEVYLALEKRGLKGEHIKWLTSTFAKPFAN
jgi:hypothetical protein